MTRIKLTSLAVLGCFCAVAAEQKDDAAMLRVVQWNIGHFAMGKASSTKVLAKDSARRAEEYRSKIAELGADIIGVSEYESIFDKAGNSATNAVFASYPFCVEGPKRNYQCNAVFSRMPIARKEVVDYKSRFQKAYFLDTVYEIGTNEVHFVQTHLDWNTNASAADARPRQIRQLINHFKNFPYVIISADWNVYGASEYYPLLMAGYTLANCGVAGCLDTVIYEDKRMPCRRFPLDNIVVKGFEVCDVSLDDKDCRLSDHRILGCTLKMKTRTR